MVEYVVLLILSLLGLTDKNKKAIFSILLCILMVILATFRADSVGTDTYQYSNRVWFAGDIDFSDGIHKHWELIFNGIYILLDDWGIKQRWILGVSSFFTILNIFIASKRSSRKIGYSVFLFLVTYYLYSYNAVRQMLSASFVLLAYTHLNTTLTGENIAIREKIKSFIKEHFWFFFFITIAALIHFSSIVVVFTILLSRVRIKKYVWTILLILSLFIGYLIDFSFLNQMLMGFENVEAQNDYTEALNLLGWLSRIIHLIFYLMILLDSDESDSKLKTFSQIFFFGIILENIFLNYNGFIRITLDFLMIQLLYLPNAIFSIRSRKQKVYLTFWVTLQSIMFIRDFLSESRHVFPYEFVNMNLLF